MSIMPSTLFAAVRRKRPKTTPASQNQRPKASGFPHTDKICDIN
jgi:hypothetical protein